MPTVVLMTILSVIMASGGHSQTKTKTYQPSDYLPLVVGNSWVYRQEAGDSDDGIMGLSEGAYREVTITIDSTQVINGKTYYVFSDMPTGASAPPHCIPGKKVRWDGHRLLEHTGSEEVAIFHFNASAGSYSIPSTEGDTEATISGHFWDEEVAGRPPTRSFEFSGYNGYADWISRDEGNDYSRQVSFVAGYGMGSCGEWVFAVDYGVASNRLYSLRATLLSPSSSSGARGAASRSTSSFWDAQFPDLDSSSQD